MADNTTINSGTGDAIRDIDKGGIKTQVMLMDLGGAGAESPLSSTNPLPVTVSNFPASQEVTGPLTDTQLRAAAVPVSLTAASSVSVSNFPSSYAVTGTFWQTTQPVSIGTTVAVSAPVAAPVFVRLSDGAAAISTLGVSMNQLPAALVGARLDVNVGALTTTSTQPVSGTFWQTTQPVSIGTTVTVGAPVGAPVFVRLSDGAAAIATLPVSVTTASSMSVICSTANTLSVAVSTAGVVAVGGNISTGTAEAGNPVKIGAAVVIAKGALPAATANGSRVALTADAYGRLADRKTDIWSKTHDPGPAVQATCNSSAQASGVRNVCTSLAMSLVTTAAPTAVAAVTFTLYDGTTAGTALWSMRAVYPAAAAGNWNFGLSDLWIEGTAATQMTFAIAAATTTNVAASVAMTGTISQ